MKGILFALIIGAIMLAVVGGYYLTQITAGVGGIAAACLLGILARLVQASIHHREALASFTVDTEEE